MLLPHPSVCLLSVVALFALGVCARAANPPDEPNPIFAAAKAAVANGRIDKSKPLGFHDEKKPYSELPDQGAILIGFDLGVGKFFDIDVIYSLRPIYLTQFGESAGDEHGLFRNRNLPNKKVLKTKIQRTVRIQARPGYAVGGMTLRSGLLINGLSLTYMKISGKGLDPTRSYASDWIGDRTGGGEKSIEGDGSPVVGIFGSQNDEHAMSLGLYFMNVPAPPPRQVPQEIKPPEPRPQPADKQPAELPAAPIKAAPPVEPPPEADEPDAAPPDPPKPAAKESVGVGQWWIPTAIFAAVTVPVFLFLLVSLGRKKPTPERARAEHRRLIARPVRPNATAANGTEPEPPTLEPYDANDGWVDPASFRLPEVESPEFRKAKFQVSTTLFGIAVAQFVIGLILVAVVPELLVGTKVPTGVVSFLAGVVIVISLLFAGLGFWARFQPLPAGAVGLGVYVLFFLLDFLANPQFVLQGIIVKIGIVVALVRAITVAAQAKKTAPAGPAYDHYSDLNSASRWPHPVPPQTKTGDVGIRPNLNPRPGP
jgi:hypothetical protein